jgi:DNA-binding CsgD family transcriptional regulator
MHALKDFVEDLDSAKDIEALNRVFQRAIEKVGMKTFGYARIGANRLDSVTTTQFHEQCVMGTTYPNEWRDRYRAKGYFAVDPIISACRTRLMPIIWDSLQLHGNAHREAVVLGEAGEFGLTRGFTVPIHTPTGEKAIVSLASDETEAAFRLRIETYQHALHLMAIHFHAQVETTVAVQPEETKVKLSPRELECLRWTADGKTAWEIAKILGISENTVNFHLKNSMAKLDVHSKTHAVAKAVTLGIGAF